MPSEPTPDRAHRYSRRRFMNCSLLAGGLGLSMADLFRLRAGTSGQLQRSPPDTAVIQLWLGGGPSQFETFDPKPEAPVEIRGPYKPIPTPYPGVHFSEHMAKTARVIEKTALIRTVTHPENGHFLATHWLSTGYPTPLEVPTKPSSGAIVSHFRGPNRAGLPAYALISEEQRKNFNIGAVMGPSYLGANHAPFTLKQNPLSHGYELERTRQATASLELANDITLDRFGDRRALLADMDHLARDADRSARMERMDNFQRAAMDLLASGEARRAFDLSLEPESTRRMYGSHRWGQMALLARRLVEAGVTFVTVNTGPDSLCWDWHKNIVNDRRPADGSKGASRGMEVSGPPLDQMLSALITDIHQRGLDQKVLLLVWGEFGRTPRINKRGGRDHWGPLMSILLTGGGLRVGQVIGASNQKGEEPVSRPVRPTEVLATVYRHLGIDWRQHTVDQIGQPVTILPDGEPIAELI